MDLDSPNLADEMEKDAIVIRYLRDSYIAQEFYRALCNMRWRKTNHLPDDEKIIDKLKGIHSDVWHCSWRASGGIIADIRNVNYNLQEDYMNYYCIGAEGEVSDTVRECFERMGWEPYPWIDYYD